MTKQDRNLHGLQILRAVAALAVVVHHTLEMSNGSAEGRFSPDWLTTCGAAGVDLFFVISGFIMVYVSFPPDRRPDAPGGFLVRRAIRIFPFYWLCTMAFIALLAAGFLRNKHVDPYTVMNSALLLPGDKLLDVAWTLSYEIYFYLAFALCLLLGRMRLTALATMALMGAGIVAGRAMPDSALARFMASPIVLEFCFGVILALLFLSMRNWRIPASLAATGFAVMAFAPLFVAHTSTAGLPDMARVLVWGIPATLVVAVFLQHGRPRSTAGRTAVLLGDASYAIYLTHVFVMIGYGWMIKWTFVGHSSQMVFVLPIILLCAIIGVLSHLYVEKPVLGLVRRATRFPPLRQPDRRPALP